jgi:hypothetical protein
MSYGEGLTTDGVRRGQSALGATRLPCWGKGPGGGAQMQDIQQVFHINKVVLGQMFVQLTVNFFPRNGEKFKDVLLFEVCPFPVSPQAPSTGALPCGLHAASAARPSPVEVRCSQPCCSPGPPGWCRGVCAPGEWSAKLLQRSRPPSGGPRFRPSKAGNQVCCLRSSPFN